MSAAPTRKLGGWTRLFIVVSALWTIAVLTTAAVCRDALFAKVESKAAETGGNRNLGQQLFDAYKSVDLKEKLERQEISEAEFKRLMEPINERQRQTEAAGTAREVDNGKSRSKKINPPAVLAFAAIWLAPLTGLFALGHAVAWVIRGFKAEVKPR